MLRMLHASKQYISGWVLRECPCDHPVSMIGNITQEVVIDYSVRIQSQRGNRGTGSVENNSFPWVGLHSSTCCPVVLRLYRCDIVGKHREWPVALTHLTSSQNNLSGAQGRRK